MSETDDTDVLLLIPPGFFLVKSSASEDSLLDSSRTVVHKPKSCTAQVLGKLVNQVYTLENRLESLELSDTLSSCGVRRTSGLSESNDTLSKKSSTFPRRRRRKTVSRQKKHDLSLTSLDSVSTFDRRVPPLKLTNNLRHIQDTASYIDDPMSMDGDLSSIMSTPNKKNDKLLLHEIDEFLTKVESYETPDLKFQHTESDCSPEDVLKATGDYINSKYEDKNSEDVRLPSGRVVSASMLDKYIYLVKNKASSLQQDKPSTSFTQSLNEDSTRIGRRLDGVKFEGSRLEGTTISETKTDQKSPSVRRLNFLESSKDVQPTSTPKKPQTNYLDTFQPTSNKIYDRATKVLEQYKASCSKSAQNSSSETNYLSSPKKEFKVPRQYNLEMKEGPKLSLLQSKCINSIDSDLLSLSDLWGDRRDGRDGSKVDSLKLEEERMKREHCESLIQDLQKKLLEQQEKLAVAVKVDRSKDAAISRLKDAWLKLTSSLDKAEDRHRNALEKMTREVENFKALADDSQKKTNHYETELYKALDLAHDYQEKCKKLTEEKKDLKDAIEKVNVNKDQEIANKLKEVEMLKENYETVMRMNRQSTDCVKNIEDALQKEKEEHECTKSKLIEMNHKIGSLQESTSVLKEERDLLKDKVNEERSRCSLLERQLAEKQNQNSELLKRCDALGSEVKTQHKLLEVQKSELKAHYQKQLEDAVLAKLQEFQLQLDSAERHLEDDTRAKENAIIDTFNKQISRIEEQHKLEINVLEEKHKEEIKLYRLQLAQSSEKISLVESKLSSLRSRRGALAGELHALMQAQWTQALRILTGGPSVSPVGKDYLSHVPPLSIPVTADRRDSNSRDESTNIDLSDNELQKYINMFLKKPAMFQGSSEDVSRLNSELVCKELGEEPTSDRPERQDRKEKGKRTLNIGKPPWKA